MQKNEKSLKRTNKHGHNLLRHFEGFSKLRYSSEIKADHLLEERDFIRFREIEVKMKLLVAEDTKPEQTPTQQNELHEDQHLESYNNVDILDLRINAKHHHEVKKVRLLTEVRWFVTLVYRLREYMKRMNNVAPHCCLKFTLVLQLVLELGFVITTPIFYRLLLSKVFIKEDFRKNIVHQLIDLVREGLNISAEDFVKFLEENDLQVSADLMNIVRMNAQKALAAATTVSMAVNAFHLSPHSPKGKKFILASRHSVTTNQGQATVAEQQTVENNSKVTEEPVSIAVTENIAQEVIPIEVVPLATLENTTLEPKDGQLAEEI